MPDRFYRRQFHSADPDPQTPAEPGGVLRSTAWDPPAPPEPAVSDDVAALTYLQEFLQSVGPARLRGTEDGTDLPQLKLRAVLDQPFTESELFKFEQTYPIPNDPTVPVFGTQAFVELGGGQKLVGIQYNLAEVGPLSDKPELSLNELLNRIAQFSGVDAALLNERGKAARRILYYDSKQDRWHLAYYFRNLPAPPGGKQFRASQGTQLVPSPDPREYDYLVDAQSGDCLFTFSSHPALCTVQLPDTLGNLREIFIEKVSAEFELTDPMRRLKTYDMGNAEFWKPLPANPVRSAGPPPQFSPAAVSAHANAAHVYDFYNSVLLRRGVDDTGTTYITSVVNVTSPDQQGTPEWRAAYWKDGTMFYGQDRAPTGELRSYARFLDIIAHELTHGVTKFTSGLIYLGQSGALSESFSDIFGVLVNNWKLTQGFAPLDQFKWQIGAELGKDGGPLRDLSNPRLTGHPDHMNNPPDCAYQALPDDDDNGGVHTNCNIHNKAAYYVLTMKGTGGNPMFAPQEAAFLYYRCLIQVGQLATFAEARDQLLYAATSYYAAQTDDVRREKLSAIREAYRKVGL